MQALRASDVLQDVRASQRCLRILARLALHLCAQCAGSVPLRSALDAFWAAVCARMQPPLVYALCVAVLATCPALELLQLLPKVPPALHAELALAASRRRIRPRERNSVLPEKTVVCMSMGLRALCDVLPTSELVSVSLVAPLGDVELRSERQALHAAHQQHLACFARSVPRLGQMAQLQELHLPAWAPCSCHGAALAGALRRLTCLHTVHILDEPCPNCKLLAPHGSGAREQEVEASWHGAVSALRALPVLQTLEVRVPHLGARTVYGPRSHHEARARLLCALASVTQLTQLHVHGLTHSRAVPALQRPPGQLRKLALSSPTRFQGPDVATLTACSTLTQLTLQGVAVKVPVHALPHLQSLHLDFETHGWGAQLQGLEQAASLRCFAASGLVAVAGAHDSVESGTYAFLRAFAEAAPALRRLQVLQLGLEVEQLCTLSASRTGLKVLEHLCTGLAGMRQLRKLSIKVGALDAAWAQLARDSPKQQQVALQVLLGALQRNTMLTSLELDCGLRDGTALLASAARLPGLVRLQLTAAHILCSGNCAAAVAGLSQLQELQLRAQFDGLTELLRALAGLAALQSVSLEGKLQLPAWDGHSRTQACVDLLHAFAEVFARRNAHPSLRRVVLHGTLPGETCAAAAREQSRALWHGSSCQAVLRQIVGWARAHESLEHLALPWPEVHEGMLQQLERLAYCAARNAAR